MQRSSTSNLLDATCYKLFKSLFLYVFIVPQQSASSSIFNLLFYKKAYLILK